MAPNVTFPASGPISLDVHLGRRSNTNALFTGAVNSSLLQLNICGPDNVIDGFKPFVREQKFDLGEIALVTYLVAKTYGKPLLLLPAVVLGRFQHGFLYYRAALGALRPKDLEGRRVAVRSYTVTTGLWVRAMLQHEHGVDLSRITWVTYEEPHVKEFKDPANVEHIELGHRTPEQLLLDGSVDAAILGSIPGDEPRLRALFDDPAAAASAWYAKYKAVPINHLVAVSSSLAEQRPDIVREACRMLLASKRATSPSGDVDMLPFGIDDLRPSMELAIGYAYEQEIIPAPLAVDDLFARF